MNNKDKHPTNDPTISVILTGGTIDKQYNENNGKLEFTGSHIPEILALGRNLAQIEITPLMLKDSLKITDSDRHKIAKACEYANSDKIVITHGTDTMVDTAKVLAKLNLQKTIVLLGAMIPYVFKQSDACFNVGFAFAAVQTLPYDVYITMNGKIFSWNDVVKNTKKGQFEELSGTI